MKEAKDVKRFTHISYKMHCHDHENGSRSFVLNSSKVFFCNWCELSDSTSKAKKVRDVIRFVTEILYKKQCHDLENRSRSLVLKLKHNLAGIHNWFKFGDST